MSCFFVLEERILGEIQCLRHKECCAKNAGDGLSIFYDTIKAENIALEIVYLWMTQWLSREKFQFIFLHFIYILIVLHLNEKTFSINAHEDTWRFQ